jgi:hypothetical protein
MDWITSSTAGKWILSIGLADWLTPETNVYALMFAAEFAILLLWLALFVHYRRRQMAALRKRYPDNKSPVAIRTVDKSSGDKKPGDKPGDKKSAEPRRLDAATIEELKGLVAAKIARFNDAKAAGDIDDAAVFMLDALTRAQSIVDAGGSAKDLLDDVCLSVETAARQRIEDAQASDSIVSTPDDTASREDTPSMGIEILDDAPEPAPSTGGDVAKLTNTVKIRQKQLIVLMGFKDSVKELVDRFNNIYEFNKRIISVQKPKAEKSKSLAGIVSDFEANNDVLGECIKMLEEENEGLDKKVGQFDAEL